MLDLSSAGFPCRAHQTRLGEGIVPYWPTALGSTCVTLHANNRLQPIHNSGLAMQTLKTVSWTLPHDLISVIEDVAVHQGTSIDETVVFLLNQAVSQCAIRGNGRCSLRTGFHSEGPRPLPLQQP